MASTTEEVHLKFVLNFNSKSYIWLAATVRDSTALDAGAHPLGKSQRP